jgi:hypothetical protein
MIAFPAQNFLLLQLCALFAEQSFVGGKRLSQTIRRDAMLSQFALIARNRTAVRCDLAGRAKIGLDWHRAHIIGL